LTNPKDLYGTDYLKIHEETRIYLERDRKASLLTHLIDVAYEHKKWVG